MQSEAKACANCGKELCVPVSNRFPLPERLLCSACVKADLARLEAEAEIRFAEQRAVALADLRADLPAALGRCGVPPHWRGASFAACADLPGELVDAARVWAAEPRGMLFFFGPPGAGKTFLAVAVLRGMLEAGLWVVSMPLGDVDFRCRYTSERDFLEELKAQFEGGRMVSPDVQEAPLLVLDDFASSRLTDWGKGELSGLLEHRHAQELPTLVTSNLSPDELAVAVDPRVASRIVESKLVYKFPARDLRIKGTFGAEAAV